MKSLSFSTSVGPISALEWTDIPQLVVLTGENGVGKTTLLEGLARVCNADSLLSRMVARSGSVSINPVPQRRVGYLPSQWHLNDAKINQQWFVQVRDHIAKLLADPDHLPSATMPVDSHGEDALDGVTRTVRRVLRAGYEPTEPATIAAVLAALGPYDIVTHDPQQPLAALAHAVLGHLSARTTHLLQRMPWDDIDARIGPPPWETANQLFREFGLRYQLEYTTDHRLPFELNFRDLDRNRIVSPASLSSGEQASMALIALVTTSTVVHDATQRNEALPELVLLDEPDAHLHTSLVKGYLDNLQRIVARGVQVVMVTHRPDTLALAPAASLFEMRRDAGNTSIMKVPSKSQLIARLAADTIAVIPSVRVVLVEDEDDRAFHQDAYDLALTFATADLPANPRLAFMPVMAKPDEDGKQQKGATGDGGWTAVRARVKDLHAQGLQSVFRGLIDGDGKTSPPVAELVRLERYSVESYWADPLGLYEWSVHRDDGVGQALASKGGLALSDLADLRSLDAARLAPVVDAVVALLETKLPATLSRDRRDVLLHRKAGDITLQYPAWLWTATKAQLEAAVTTAFTHSVRNPWKNALKVTGFIPADLVDAYRRLITERL